MYFAAEDNDCCTRNCCGPSRPFTIRIIDNLGHEVITLQRPLRCSSCCFPCCLQEVSFSLSPSSFTWDMVHLCSFKMGMSCIGTWGEISRGERSVGFVRGVCGLRRSRCAATLRITLAASDYGNEKLDSAACRGTCGWCWNLRWRWTCNVKVRQCLL